MRSTLSALVLTLAVAPLSAQRSTTPPPTGPAAPTVILPAPVGVTVRNAPGELVFAWQPVVGAIGYQIDAAPAVAGPWAALVPQPLASNAFIYKPAPGALMYYRIAAVHALGNAGNPTTVPFIYNPPLYEAAASAAQSGGDVTVSWAPIDGAVAYAITTDAASQREVQFFGPSTSATLPGLIPSPTTGVRSLRFSVVAQFARGVAVSFGKSPSMRQLDIADPALCWPQSVGTPGGPAPAQLSAAPMGNAVGVTWLQVGQVLAYHVERALGNSGQWQSIGCTSAPLLAPFVDHSIALQPQVSYTYRVTAIGPNGITGTSLTTIQTPPPETPIVAVQVYAQNVGLELQTTVSHASAYIVSSSYGYRSVDRVMTQTGTHSTSNVPVGTHQFTLRPLYANGIAGRAMTTVTVTVQ